MTIGKINVEESIGHIQQQIAADKSLSPALVQSINVLIILIQLLVQKLGLDSSNSSLPPSKDPKTKKKKTSARKKSDKPSGGQPGHEGDTLMLVDEADETIELEIDRLTLPEGVEYKSAGFERRQIIDVVMDICVTEYRAEVLEDSNGTQYVATFPEHVTKAVQYGASVKALSTYLSQYQLIPYNRVQEAFSDQFGLDLSQGSIANFNKEAYERLAGFEENICQKLKKADVLNADETGIKIGDTTIFGYMFCLHLRRRCFSRMKNAGGKL